MYNSAGHGRNSFCSPTHDRAMVLKLIQLLLAEKEP